MPVATPHLAKASDRHGHRRAPDRRAGSVPTAEIILNCLALFGFDRAFPRSMSRRNHASASRPSSIPTNCESVLGELSQRALNKSDGNFTRPLADDLYIPVSAIDCLQDKIPGDAEYAIDEQ
jgi:hypothetical protein